MTEWKAFWFNAENIYIFKLPYQFLLWCTNTKEITPFHPPAAPIWMPCCYFPYTPKIYFIAQTILLNRNARNFSILWHFLSSSFVRNDAKINFQIFHRAPAWCLYCEPGNFFTTRAIFTSIKTVYLTRKTFSNLKLANRVVVTMTTMYVSETAWLHAHINNFVSNVRERRMKSGEKEIKRDAVDVAAFWMKSKRKKKRNPRFNNNKQKYFIVIKYLFIVLCKDGNFFQCLEPLEFIIF